MGVEDRFPHREVGPPPAAPRSPRPALPSSAMADPFAPENVVRAFFAALNARDYRGAASHISDNCEWWSMPTDNMHRGPSSIIGGLDEFTHAFPDWRAEVERVTASGPIAVVEWMTSGTFIAPFRGRLPNGKPFRRR